MPGGHVVHHPVSHALQISAEGSAGWIERLCHKLAAASEQKKSIGVDGVRLGMKKWSIFPSVEGRIVQRIVCGLRWVVDNREIEEVFTVRKKERPTVRSVLCEIQPGDLRWRSAISADADQRLLGIRRKHNNAVGSPRTAPPEVCIAKSQRSAPIQINRS